MTMSIIIIFGCFVDPLKTGQIEGKKEREKNYEMLWKGNDKAELELSFVASRNIDAMALQLLATKIHIRPKSPSIEANFPEAVVKHYHKILSIKSVPMHMATEALDQSKWQSVLKGLTLYRDVHHLVRAEKFVFTGQSILWYFPSNKLKISQDQFN